MMRAKILYVVVVASFCWTMAAAQLSETRLEVHGFIMVDAGYNFNLVDPAWFDVMRPTKLPSYEGEFAPSGSVFFSVRQTRLGIRSSTHTPLGPLTARFDFDLFGFGDNIGQTTFHLINAYAELGRFGAGQTASVFMDQDVFPVTLDYWGPSSRTFFFNIQVRYTLVENLSRRIAIALERPGATADGSDYRTHLDIEHVEPQFAVPNLTAHYRKKGKWGHVQSGVVLKWMKWKDLNDTSAVDLSGNAFGWGINVSGAIKVHRKIFLKSQVVYGRGIQNYTADAPTDIALESGEPGGSVPYRGEPLPLFGAFAFAEINWSKFLRSSVGYSLEEIQNTDLQNGNAFRRGEYALANLRYYPVENVQAGIEYQFGRRGNFSDGYQSTASKLQVSVKVNFSSLIN